MSFIGIDKMKRMSILNFVMKMLYCKFEFIRL